jgi:hypothetical protein
MSCENNLGDILREAKSKQAHCYLDPIANQIGFLCQIYNPIDRAKFPITPSLDQVDMYQSSDLNFNYPNVPNIEKRYLAFNVFEKDNRDTYGNALLDSFITGSEPYLMSNNSVEKNSIVIIFTSGKKTKFFSFKVLHSLEVVGSDTAFYYKIELEPYT